MNDLRFCRFRPGTGTTLLRNADESGLENRFIDPSHFFSAACQFVTTMNGEGALAPSGADTTRKRLPSAMTSPA